MVCDHIEEGPKDESPLFHPRSTCGPSFFRRHVLRVAVANDQGDHCHNSESDGVGVFRMGSKPSRKFKFGFEKR